jgi:ubiquinone/menaquinone biosynthesis C-methylase UbiE
MSFDPLAPFYDLLARTMFGRKLFRAKTFFVPHLQPYKTLLIMGGGTGEAVNFILNSHPQLEITFIEPSIGMMKKAQQRLDEDLQSRIHFIHGNQFDIPAKTSYDGITLFFVMDTMKNKTNEIFMKELCSHLKLNGIILFADFFQTKNHRRNFLTWIMYRFFRITTRMEATSLPDYNQIFTANTLSVVSAMSWQNGYIRSMVLQKKNSV